MKHTDYFFTFTGQLEYMLMCALSEAFRQNLINWPSTYYGGYNAIQLYLTHASYSPFVMTTGYHRTPASCEWRQDWADQVAKQLREEREQCL